MNIQVIYHSQSGNTKKVAEAIAQELKVTAIPIEQAKDIRRKPIDLLLIGDGMYFGGMSGQMKQFIDTLEPQKIKTAAVFSTSGGSWPMGPAGLQKRLAERNIVVLEQSFKCHGSAFGVAFPSHPNEADLANARKFARSVAESMKEG
ncbi:MAG: flavodoxin [Oscillospiraceae bacterium]|nr:flavodoxin [Oscillospiraceae bacterium]